METLFWCTHQFTHARRDVEVVKRSGEGYKENNRAYLLTKSL